ncbi:hypothetical protein [Nocardioides alkalitolerans]|uniref:hypothetical protein n=1 Tax=Nocardioides alkalitolerans TaxID=281714 RepID=UPI000427BD9F|nr:hypothetical protein [Nocardioides alkalitolerans]
MSDPGPQPDPTIEPAEPNPGGPDAIDESGRYGTDTGELAIPDLDPAKNPATEDVVPDEVKAADDKQQAPAEGEDDREPAEDSDGETEPPA